MEGDDQPINVSLENAKVATKRTKRIVIGSLLALVCVIVAAVVAGVVVSQHKKKSSNLSTNPGSSSSGSSSSGPNPSGGPPVVSNPNDPSNFKKDPRLHHSFWGIAYAPEGVSQYPNCTGDLSQIITDMQLMSQLTSRIRLYGADCNQSALVLEAIKQTKVNMGVYLANYNLYNDNGTAYSRQKTVLQDAIQTYGTDNILGITVGNEFMLNFLTDKGGADPNSAIANQGAQLLIADIKDTRTMLAGMNLKKQLPVGNSDAGAYFNNLVLAAIDYGMANVHPWFGSVAIADAAGWTYSFFETTDVVAAQALPNNPQMYIAETGWPTASDDAAHETDGPSTASMANLQTFLDSYVCQANTNKTGYFYFEYFDEIWQAIEYGGVEGHWGLFYANRTLKEVTIPNCPIA